MKFNTSIFDSSRMSLSSKKLSTVDISGSSELDGKYEWLAYHIFKNYVRTHPQLFINSSGKFDILEKEIKHPLDIYDKILYSKSELVVYVQNREIIPSNNLDDTKTYKIPHNHNGYEITLLFRNEELYDNCWTVINRTEINNPIVKTLDDTEQALYSVFTGIPDINSLFIPDEINAAGIDSDEFYNYIANDIPDSLKTFWKWEDSYTAEHKMLSLIKDLETFDKDVLRKEWDNFNHLTVKLNAFEKQNSNNMFTSDYMNNYPTDIKYFAKAVTSFDWKCKNTPHNAIIAMGNSQVLKFCIDCIMELPNAEVSIKKHNTMNLYKVATCSTINPNGRTSSKNELVAIAKNLPYGSSYQNKVVKK